MQFYGQLIITRENILLDFLHGKLLLATACFPIWQINSLERLDMIVSKQVNQKTPTRKIIYLNRCKVIGVLMVALTEGPKIKVSSLKLQSMYQASTYSLFSY